MKTVCVPCRNCHCLGKEEQDKFVTTKMTHIATLCAEILAKERLLHCCVWSGLSFAQTETVPWLAVIIPGRILNVLSKGFTTLKRGGGYKNANPHHYSRPLIRKDTIKMKWEDRWGTGTTYSFAGVCCQPVKLRQFFLH